MSRTRDNMLADLVGPREAATALGIDLATWRKWRERYDLPGPVLVLSGQGVWSRRELLRWRERGGGPRPRRSPEHAAESEVQKPKRGHLRAVE